MSSSGTIRHTLDQTNSTTNMTTTATNTDDNTDHSSGLLAIVIAFEVLSILAVGLRLLARKLTRNSLWWDDYLALIAAALSIANLANDIHLIQLGAGRHFAHVGSTEAQGVIPFLQDIYIGQVLYVPVIGSIKLTILLLYLRLFSPIITFRKSVYVLIALTTAWMIASFIPIVLQCIPIAAAWDMELAKTARCVNLGAMLVGSNVPDILLDLLILVVPLPVIWGLKIPMSKRLAIIAIFALGAFDSAMAIVRLTTLLTLNAGDFTIAFTGPMVWSTIEINVGLTCACLPVMAPVAQKIFGRWLDGWSQRSSANKSGHNTAAAHGYAMDRNIGHSNGARTPRRTPARDGFESLDDEDSSAEGKSMVNAGSRSNAPSANGSALGLYEQGGIEMRTSIEITRGGK